MEMRPSSLVFTVERSEPELITPSKPTPYEFKFLSDLDSIPAHRSHAPIILVFQNSVGGDSVKVITVYMTHSDRDTLAGRLLEGPKGKLIIECNAEGILFTEAYANVRLDQFGFLPPPFPGADELLYDIPGSRNTFQTPLVMFQVTRLLCGGFIFASRTSHIMLDGGGCAQFLKAIGEIAHGASVPSVPPVWSRKQLNRRRPQSIILPVNEGRGNLSSPFDGMTPLSHRSFFFGPKEITALKSHLLATDDDVYRYTRWEMITACIWRCRTGALSFSSDDQVYLLSAVNIRTKMNPPLSIGFYGNGSVGTLTVTTVGKLCQEPFRNVVELVKTAKTKVTEEFVKSSIDGSGEPPINMARAYIVTDLSRLGFHDCDFGWGTPAYWSPPWDCPIASTFSSITNVTGENGLAITIQLPQPAMKKFAVEIAKMVKP